MGDTREEIVSVAIGDGGNLTRAIAAIEALHRAGYAVQKPPTDSAPLIASLRQRGQYADANDVEELAMELEKFRGGWGPSTPTERTLRHADLRTARRYLEQAAEVLIELNLSNYTDADVAEANNGTIEATGHLNDGMRWINDRIRAAVCMVADLSESAIEPERRPVRDITMADECWAIANPEGVLLPWTVRRSIDSAIAAVVGDQRMSWEDLVMRGWSYAPVRIVLR